MKVLGREGANILLPRLGFPDYDSIVAYKGIEVRYYDLLPERDWEIDLGQVEAIADNNTVAMVIINPSNPCGVVFRREHLCEVCMCRMHNWLFPMVSFCIPVKLV